MVRNKIGDRETRIPGRILTVKGALPYIIEKKTGNNRRMMHVGGLIPNDSEDDTGKAVFSLADKND